MKYRVFRTLPLFVVLSAVAFAQDLASFEKRITVKKLNNGLTVVICERPEAPVFAFFTHVDAGHVLEHVRHTGLAQRILHRARIHVSEESKYGGLRTLADHHGEAVIQLFDRDAFLERSKVLGEGYSGKHHEQWQGSENAVFHRASSADWDQTRRENLKLRAHRADCQTGLSAHPTASHTGWPLY